MKIIDHAAKSAGTAKPKNQTDRPERPAVEEPMPSARSAACVPASVAHWHTICR